jgi:hypothetical protein
MANAEGLTQPSARDELRSSRSIQEFRIDFLLEEEFACDLTLIQKLIDLSGLMGNALRVEKIIHSLNDRHGEADLARPIREGTGFLVRWMRPNTASDEAHRTAFGFSTA